MPLYEYICDQCHRHVEKIQSFSAPPLEVCPHCGGHLVRALSAPAVQFKGSGWYVSDYGKSGAKKTASGDTPSSGTAEISASAATESPANKTESAPAPKSATSAVSDGPPQK